MTTTLANDPRITTRAAVRPSIGDAIRLTDAQLDAVAGGGSGAGINPSRTQAGLSAARA